MIKRSPTKPVRVVPPMMEEQEVSTITLQKWLDREETVSHLLFCKGKEEGIDKSYKSFKSCTFPDSVFGSNPDSQRSKRKLIASPACSSSSRNRSAPNF